MKNTGKPLQKKKTRQSYWGEVIMQYLGKFCVYCGSLENLHIHHKIPLERGGYDRMDNLEIVCSYCHILIHKTWNLYIPKTQKEVMNICTNCENMFSSKSHRSLCPNCRAFVNSKNNKKQNAKKNRV